MSQKSMLRTFAVLVLLTMLAAACGQKQGVHVGFSGAVGGVPGATPTDGAVAFTDADGDGVDDTTGLSSDEFATSFGSGSGTDVAGGGGGTTSGGTTSGGTTGGTSGSSTGGSSGGSTGGSSGGSGGSGGGSGGGGGGGGGGGSQSGGTSQGVTADTITIGIHAPLTGAAPLPSESFRSGKDQYWNFEGHTVEGRKVRVEFRDDKYNPSSASQVCQELVSSVKVFLLVGAGGADQIAECARVAAAAGVPYLSSGVTERSLNQMPTYFALSQSYAQQMTPLMQLINAQYKPGNKIVGLVASNTANFDDAVAAFDKAAKGAGLTPKIYRPNKQPSKAEIAALAQKMAQDGVTVATPVMAPTQWIELASNPQLSNTNWHGVGITMGLNTVATAICQSARHVDGATFFSPWMGLNMSNQVDPNFKEGGGTDDIQWSLWGLNKTIHAAFKKMGKNLNHQAFVSAMTSGIRSGIYPNLNHTQSNHFGVDSVHVVRLSCADRQFISTSKDTFKKGF